MRDQDARAFRYAATPIMAGLHTLGIALLAFAVSNPGYAILGSIGGILIGFTYSYARARP